MQLNRKVSAYTRKNEAKIYSYAKDIYKALVKNYGIDSAKQAWYEGGINFALIGGYATDVYVLYNSNLKPFLEKYYKISDKHPIITLKDETGIDFDLADGLYKTLPKSLTGEVSTNTWQDYKEVIYTNLNKKIEDFNKKVDANNKKESSGESSEVMISRALKKYEPELLNCLNEPNNWKAEYFNVHEGLISVKLSTEHFVLRFKGLVVLNKNEVEYKPVLFLHVDGESFAINPYKYDLHKSYNKYVGYDEFLAKVKERRFNYVADKATSGKNRIAKFFAKRKLAKDFKLDVEFADWAMVSLPSEDE